MPSYDNTSSLFELRNFRAAIRWLKFVELRYRINTRLLTLLTLRVIYNRSFHRCYSDDVATRGLNCRRWGIPMYNTAHIPDATCSPGESKKTNLWERSLAFLLLLLSLFSKKEILCRRPRQPPVFYCRHIDFSATCIKIINDAIKIYAAANLYPTERALVIRSQPASGRFIFFGRERWSLTSWRRSDEPNE